MTYDIDDDGFAEAFDDLKAAKGQKKGFSSSNVQFLPGFHSSLKEKFPEKDLEPVNFHDPFKGRPEGVDLRTGFYNPYP